jgi:hypothetical protein
VLEIEHQLSHIKHASDTLIEHQLSSIYAAETPHHSTPCPNDVIEDTMEELSVFPHTAAFSMTNGVLLPIADDTLAKVAHQRVLADNSKTRARAVTAAATEASAVARVLKK